MLKYPLIHYNIHKYSEVYDMEMLDVRKNNKLTEFIAYDFICMLYDNGYIQKGDFTLKSGLKSEYFYDLKSVCDCPELLRLLCRHALYLVPDANKYCIAGVPMGAISYASCISNLIDSPMILIREVIKPYGNKRQIEGKARGREVLVVEDVITTGKTVLETIKIIEKNGLKVAKVLCILNREQGGTELLKQAGYSVVNLLYASDAERLLNARTIPNKTGRAKL